MKSYAILLFGAFYGMIYLKFFAKEGFFMAIKTVLFDLDGTLLPMDLDTFIKAYFRGIAEKMASFGYDSKKLVDAIWQGTGAMVKNNSDQTNEHVFWQAVTSIYGEQILDDQKLFDQFYASDFPKIRAVCGYDPMAAQAVYRLKEKGYPVVLATSPIFPAVATQQRICWAGLQPEDFLFYTTYENCRRAKPSLDYYRDILDKLQLPAKECLMVGNDVAEDMVAQQLGMQVFLLTDCLINKYDQDISPYPQGGFPELLRYIETLPNLS